MTLTQKLTTAITLFKELNKCFTTAKHNEFCLLRDVIQDEVSEEDFKAIIEASL